MPGISLGNDFNAELVALAGWTTDSVDASTVSVDYLNPGGPTTVRVTATANVDTDALSTLIRKYTPLPVPVTDEPEPTDEPASTDTASGDAETPEQDSD